MQCPRLALFATLFTTGLVAQTPKVERPEPVGLVSKAEQALQKPEQDRDVEAAVMMLWQALAELATRPSNAVHEATTLSARFLLQQHDPREAERRRVFTAIAKSQVELATAYRTKKWFDTAATRLDVADALDRDAGAKERAALLAALPKAPVAAPAKKPDAAKPLLPAMLQRSGTKWTFGNWREAADHLASPALPPNDNVEWITNTTHGDHEIVVEWKPEDPSKDCNLALCVGLGKLDGSTSYSGFRAKVVYHTGPKMWGVHLWEIVEQDVRELTFQNFTLPPSEDGWHRLAVQVHGSQLRAILDNQQPVTAATSKPPLGCVGLFVGDSKLPSGPVRFRNLRVDPLPADTPSDDELRAAAESERQNAITNAVDAAKALLAKKQMEPAALALRGALADVREMSPGVLRDNLVKSIQQMLGQADPLQPKRQKAAQDATASLAALSQQYATAGWARCALTVALRAADFDPDGQTALVAKAREALQQWNVTQASKRANELAPPQDDGTVLKAWFTAGQLLDSRTQPWTHANGGVRLDDFADGMSVLMAKVGSPALSKASVHARLPALGTWAGFAFDVAGPHDYAIAAVWRHQDGVELAVQRYAGGKWLAVSRRKVPMDAWRLDGWFGIEIEAKPTGVTLKAAGNEVVVERARLAPATPRFGLCAGSQSEERVAIELRAFAVPQ